MCGKFNITLFVEDDFPRREEGKKTNPTGRDREERVGSVPRKGDERCEWGNLRVGLSCQFSSVHSEEGEGGMDRGISS